MTEPIPDKLSERIDTGVRVAIVKNWLTVSNFTIHRNSFTYPRDLYKGRF